MREESGLSHEASQALRVAWLDVLVVCARLGESQVMGVSAEEVRGRILAQLKEGRSRLLLQRVPEGLVDRVQKPVVALVDESARRCQVGDFGMGWKPLAVEIYGHDRLGGDVFADIDRLRVEPQVPVEILEVFVRCLSLGMEGQLLSNQPQALKDLRESLVAEIRRRKGQEPPLCAALTQVGQSRAGAPILAPHWIVACALAMLLFTAVVLSLLLRAETSAVERELRPYLAEVAPSDPGGAP